MPLQWREWLDIDTWKILVRHGSGVAGAMAVFWFIGFLIEKVIKDDSLKGVLDKIESFGLVGLLGWFLYQTGVLFWNRREKIVRAVCFLVT